jgi:hypothetical protein
MGTHGRGRLAGALLGSVSREVLHCARMPVLLLPAKCAGPAVQAATQPTVAARESA